jgi:hypothetical protein
VGTVATARAKKFGGCQGADCENAVAAEPLVVWLLVFARCPALELMSGIYDRGVRDGVFRGNLDPVEIYLSILTLNYFYVSNRYMLSAYLGINLAGEQLKS